MVPRSSSNAAEFEIKYAVLTSCDTGKDATSLKFRDLIWATKPPQLPGSVTLTSPVVTVTSAGGFAAELEHEKETVMSSPTKGWPDWLNRRIVRITASPEALPAVLNRAVTSRLSDKTKAGTSKLSNPSRDTETAISLPLGKSNAVFPSASDTPMVWVPFRITVTEAPEIGLSEKSSTLTFNCAFPNERFGNTKNQSNPPSNKRTINTNNGNDGTTESIGSTTLYTGIPLDSNASRKE